MSDTPRTDEAIREELFREVPAALIVDAAFAQQLERDLKETTDRLSAAIKALNEVSEQLLAVQTQQAQNILLSTKDAPSQP